MKFKMIYLLYDPVHLFKYIRNNWITEKTQIVDFCDPDSNELMSASWKDLITIYKSESNGDIKLTKLDHRTLYPNNFEKQKVYLVCNVFNEKTCIVLAQNNMKGTHTFVRNVTRMWNILNIKSPTVGIRINDDDRQPFIDSNDERLTFLVDMATCFKKMNNSVLGKRIRGFTNHTSNALHLTINGFVDVIKTLLSSEYTYMLPGKIE